MSFECRSLPNNIMHLGKMDNNPFFPIMLSQCAYLAKCIVKTILFEYTIVTKDDLSQNRPIYVYAPFPQPMVHGAQYKYPTISYEN